MTISLQSRLLLRQTRTAALGTAMPETGHPYVSLVNVATDIVGQPLLLISKLAIHTQNLLSDRRASLLVCAPDDTRGEDPLTRMRITLIGTMREAPDVRERYLAVHPAASLYAGFADFSFWRLEPESVHAVAGFGRISTFPGQDMLLPPEAAAAFAAIEGGATQHMNEDHTDVIGDFARMLGQPPGDWRMATADLDGLDLVLGERTVRLPFPEPLASPDRLRPVLIEMAKAARAGA